MPRTTNLPKAEIVAAYNAGATVQSLADKYQREFATMRANLHRWGADMRRRGPARNYTLDEHFFDVIDTEAKAYWLGFLIADGCVSQTGSNNWVLRVDLAVKDTDHLRKLIDNLASSAPIKSGHNGKSAYVDFCSVQLCRQLIELDVFPRKTAVHGTPELPPHLYRHFYRGATDGDGSIGFKISRKNVGTAEYSLVGSPRFIRQYQTWLMLNLGLKPNKLFCRNEVLVLQLTGVQQVKRVCSFLYEDATIFLDRKYEKYRRLIEFQPNPTGRPRK